MAPLFYLPSGERNLSTLSEKDIITESRRERTEGISETHTSIRLNLKKKREKYAKYLFGKLQRNKGMLERDCDRLVRNDRVVWASCMVACKDADAMVTGNTRRYSSSLERINLSKSQA